MSEAAGREREARAAVHEALAAFGERPTMRNSDAIDAALDEYRAAVAAAVREECEAGIDIDFDPFRRARNLLRGAPADAIVSEEEA